MNLSNIQSALSVGSSMLYLYAGYNLYSNFPSSRNLLEVFQNTVTKALNNFKSSGKDSSQFMSEYIDSTINGFDSKKIATSFTKNLNEGMDTLTKNLNFAKNAADIGKEFAKSIKNISNPSINALTDAISQFNTNFLWATLPQTATFTLGTTGLYLSLYYIYEVAKHSIGKPKLATETKTVSLTTRTIDWIMQPASAAKSLIFSSGKDMRPVFSPEIQEQIDGFSKSLINSQKNGGYMENLLLHGPGGTGKTMIAKQIAEQSGLSYISMSGGDLGQYIARGEHVTELNKLMEKAKSRPTILFIDEVEGLARNREKSERVQNIELLNAYLNHTGGPQKNLVVIAATNLPQELDEAFLSRMDHKVQIGAPAHAERSKIIDSYMRKFFTQAQLKGVYNNNQLNWMTSKTEGMTGRALFKMINVLKNRVTSSDKNQLTTDLIDKIVTQFVKQESPNKKNKGFFSR